MKDELRRDWERLEARALELVRDENHFERRGPRLFRIVVEPSFDDAVCWGVYSDAASPDGGHFAGRAVWRRGPDVEKLRTPLTRLRHLAELSPTVEYAVFELPRGFAETCLGLLESVSVPPAPGERILGVDGTSYELTVGHFFAAARFSWWEQGPAAWKGLAGATRTILERLEAFTSDGQSNEPTI